MIETVRYCRVMGINNDRNGKVLWSYSDSVVIWRYCRVMGINNDINGKVIGGHSNSR
jgi:hypothetical protein